MRGNKYKTGALINTQRAKIPGIMNICFVFNGNKKYDVYDEIQRCIKEYKIQTMLQAK